MAKITLITGAARSGKSAYALTLAREEGGRPRRAFIVATAEALDDEMRARIAHHRASRPAEFETIEEPLNIGDALASLDGRATVVVLDCLTLWISNLLLAGLSDDEILSRADHLAEALGRVSFASVVVTDEVGAGIVPNNALARRFRDLLGWTNQKIAARADAVVMMVAGLAIRLK